MINTLRGIALAAAFTLAFVPAGFAQDAMATDAMANAEMTPITDDELNLCLEQAGGITFPAAQHAATAACHGLHQGMDVMGAIENAMGADPMAPADAMAPAAE